MGLRARVVERRRILRDILVVKMLSSGPHDHRTLSRDKRVIIGSE